MSFNPNDPASFDPSMGEYKELKPFRFWCQKVLPLVYDDSLSYYELLCKVVDYLNKTMEDVETLNGDVESINDSYLELQNWVNVNYEALVTYVNNYFDNLDVQEEINHKLDVMAEDGTLDALLLPYFNEYKGEINGIVTTQNSKIAVLEGRMDEFASLTEGSTTGDAELMDIRVGYDGTIYPSAGDAVRSQVGELHSALNSALTDVEDSIGEYNGDSITVTVTTGKNLSPSDGTVVDATYNGISSHISVTPFQKYYVGMRTSNASAQYSFFDSNDDVIDFYCDPTLGGSLTSKTYYCTAPYGASYMILGGGSSLAPFANPVYLNDVQEKFTEYDYEDSNISGTIINSSAVDCRTGTFRSGDGYNRTDYIPVNQIEVFKYSGKINNYMGIYGYDEQKRPVRSVLDRIAQADSHVYEDEVLTIPDGVYYIIASNKIETAQPEPVITMSTTLKTEITLVKSEIAKNSTAIDESLITSSISLFHTFAVLGDSFSSGAIYGISGTTNGAHYDMSWGKILGRLKGMDCTNYATPGITTAEWLGVAQDPQHDPFLPTMLADDPWNLYLIMLGINDTKNGNVATDCFIDWTQNADTFAGNYGRVIGNIKAHAPKAKIVCIKPPHGSPYSAQFDLIGEVAEFYGVPCINAFDDPYFMSEYYNNNMSTSHPVGATYAGMASAIARLVEKAMVTEIDYFKDYEP